MTRVKWQLLASSACALMLAIPLSAGSGPAAKANKGTTAASAMRTAWPPETLSGKIANVDPNQKLVILKTPDGTFFDMVVTAKTRIKSGDQAVTLKDLTQDVNKTISVRFTPERRGDVANTIRING